MWSVPGFLNTVGHSIAFLSLLDWTSTASEVGTDESMDKEGAYKEILSFTPRRLSYYCTLRYLHGRKGEKNHIKGSKVCKHLQKA